GVPPEQLGGQPSSAKVVAEAFADGRLVKGFNHLGAAILERDPAVHGGRRVVFLASDDEDAAGEIGELAKHLGFSPIALGGLSEGGLLVRKPCGYSSEVLSSVVDYVSSLRSDPCPALTRTRPTSKRFTILPSTS